MTSVERVLEYTHLKQERTEAQAIPPPGWPTNGSLVFRDMSLFYDKNDKPALDQVTFDIQDKEKVSRIQIFTKAEIQHWR